MPIFRPSCVVNIRLKFDEALTLLPAGPPESVDDRVKAPLTGTGVRQPMPLILQEDSSKLSWISRRVPKKWSFEKPGYRQAGKFDLLFDFRDLPIDPRTVRAAAVEIHLGCVSDEQFSRGYTSVRDEGKPVSSILSPSDRTRRFVGIVDEWDDEHAGNGSEVHLAGRDLRGVLIDTTVSPLSNSSEQFLDSIDMSQDIQAVVLQVLAYNPFFEDITVVTNPADWPNATLPSPGAVDLVPRHRKGARGKRKGAVSTPPASSSATNMSFWDMIVRCCYLVGGIPYFRGTELVIRPAMTVYDKLRGPVDPKKNPTPFAGGQVRDVDAVAHAAISPALRARRLVYGRDVEKFGFKRKFGGWKRPKIVRAISEDHSQLTQGLGKILIGIWPPITEEQVKRTKRSPGKEKSMEEILNIPVHGIVDIGRLTQIAKAVYNEMGRGEVGGEVVTPNLASFGGDDSDPDLLGLDPGDGVELLVDTRAVSQGAPLVSTLTDHHRNSFEDQVNRIFRVIGDRNLARVIVATARGQVAELQRFFRVENIKFTGDLSNVKINFDFQNYVVARDQTDNASAAPGVAQALAVPTKEKSSKPSGRSLRSL